MSQVDFRRTLMQKIISYFCSNVYIYVFCKMFIQNEWSGDKLINRLHEMIAQYWPLKNMLVTSV